MRRKTFINQRLDYTLQAARRNAQAPVTQDLKYKGSTMLVIPRLLPGTQWILPAKEKLRKIGNAIVNGVLGTTRKMRCPEIVGCIIHDPARVHPAATIVTRNLLNMRRVCLKSDKRRDDLISGIRILQRKGCRLHIPGPAHAAIQMAELFDSRLVCVKKNVEDHTASRPRAQRA